MDRPASLTSYRLKGEVSRFLRGPAAFLAIFICATTLSPVMTRAQTPSPSTTASPPAGVWAAAQSETGDLIFSFASLAVGLCAIVIAIFIFVRQRRDGKLLENRIFGTLPSVEAVEQKMVELLELAERSPDSTVSLMVYWAWFGADQQFPAIDVANLNAGHSRVAPLLHSRFAKNLETKLVMFDEGDRLAEFVCAVLNYQGKKKSLTLSEADVSALLARYERNVSTLMQHQEQRKENSQLIRAEALRVKEVPNLLFAMRGGGVEAGIIYLGEISTLEENAPTGGFYTEDPRMVDILKQQIAAFRRPPSPQPAPVPNATA